MNRRQCTLSEFAKMSGLKVETLRRYRTVGQLPKEDGMLGKSPWWYEATITKWIKTPRIVGRPRKTEKPSKDWRYQRKVAR